MKQILLLLFLGCLSRPLLAQDSGPKAVTAQMRQKIAADIEKLILAFKQKRSKDRSVPEIEFMADTFRIERMYVKTMDIDYSTAGMADAIGERTKAYDPSLGRGADDSAQRQGGVCHYA